MGIPKLAIGPANHAGQAHAWAQAVNRDLVADAWSFTGAPRRGRGFQFDSDRALSEFQLRNPLFHRSRSRLLLRGTTHIALDGFRTFFRARQRGKFGADAQWLANNGWQVALISHGTDTRSPERHMDRLKWSYFRDGEADWRASLSTSSAENRLTAEATGLPVFFSTPDLAFDLPQGTWLPVAIDVEQWMCDEPLLERAVPRVVHIPSNSVVKGTKYVAAAMEELVRRGLIDYVSPDRMPHSQMRAVIQSADIVIDQVLTGAYGVAAVEAMAAGRVLIGGLADDVAELMPEVPSFLPADPSNLKDIVLSVLDRRDEMRRDATKNVAFVRRWHDGRESSRRLAPFLGAEEVS